MSKKVRGHKGSKFNVSVTGRHVDVTEGMKNHAKDKLEKIKKYFPRVIDIQVIMDIQKFIHKVEINLQANHINITATEKTKDMYVSIDQAVSKIQRQLKRYKNKVQDHRPREASLVEIPMNVLKLEKVEDDFEPKVIKTEKLSAKPMFIDEALVQIKLSRQSFLVFNNAENERINIMYKMEDGNYGIIEP